MRASRHLLILTLLAAAWCSDRDAALATPMQPRATPTQGLMRRLSARLRAAIPHRRWAADPIATANVEPTRPLVAITRTAVPLHAWLLNLPPPATA